MKYAILFFIFFHPFILSAQSEKEKKVVKKESKGKTYSKEELDKFVIDALEKKLKKIGRSKILNFSKVGFSNLKVIFCFICCFLS